MCPTYIGKKNVSKIAFRKTFSKKQDLEFERQFDSIKQLCYRIGDILHNNHGADFLFLFVTFKALVFLRLTG